MTKQKKSSRGLYPQMGNNRWKWMAGATAATAAGVTASQASAMTINLLNNYISAFGGNHLNADLTGDGHPDLTISGSRISHFGHYVGYTYLYAGTARVVLNGVPAYAMFSTDYHVAGVALGSRTAHSLYGSAASLTGSIPIFFKD